MSPAKERVVAKASRMIADHGYAAVSMRDLGRALGIQAPSLYSHFPSTDAILRAVVTPLLDQVDHVLGDAPAAMVSRVDRRAWLAAYAAVLAADPVVARIIATDPVLREDRGIAPRTDKQYQRLEDVLFTLGAPDKAAAIGVVGSILYAAAFGQLGTDQVAAYVAQLDGFFGGSA